MWKLNFSWDNCLIKIQLNVGLVEQSSHKRNRSKAIQIFFPVLELGGGALASSQLNSDRVIIQLDLRSTGRSSHVTKIEGVRSLVWNVNSSYPANSWLSISQQFCSTEGELLLLDTSGQHFSVWPFHSTSMISPPQKWIETDACTPDVKSAKESRIDNMDLDNFTRQRYEPSLDFKYSVS